MQRAASNIRDSILNENVTVTMAASSVSPCLTSPGNKPGAGRGLQERASAPVQAQRFLPARRAPGEHSENAEKGKMLTPFLLALSPHPGRPLRLAFCPSRFLFPGHLSSAHSCFFLISSPCLEYFFLPESSWQTCSYPSKLTSFLWHSLTLQVFFCSWRTLHLPLFCDV